jgi:NAD(P)-dependent dehydrogenase (short-subunit alcohol dehydrogenase family)
LRRELRGRGVAVTTINPGPVKTMFAKRASRGDRPTEELGESRMVGVSPGLVAFAVERAVRMGGMPGWSTISVPRVVGLSRLGAVPGLQWVVEAGSLVSRQAVPRGRARPRRRASSGSD